MGKESFLGKLFGLSKKDLEMAGKFGGSDWQDWEEYERIDTTPSFDKGGHKERSVANDPKHINHWKKVWRENQNQK